MGTNYYTMENEPCPTCAHGGEDYHIGKSSAGWKFLFASYPEEGLTSKHAWSKFLHGRRIRDEYDREISYDEFFKLVAEKQFGCFGDGNPFYTLETYGQADYRRYEYLDDEGYRISTTYEFS